MTLKAWLAVFVLLTSFFAYSTFSYQAQLIELYAEQNKLLMKLSSEQDTWCEGLAKVNKICEESFIDIMSRLGLDKDAYPLINTVLWQRVTHDMPIDRARRIMNAENHEYLTDENLSDVAMGGGDQ